MRSFQKLDQTGNSLLHYAAMRNLPKTVALLIEKNLSPNQQNRMGETPLHFAALANQANMVTLLLDNQADRTICNNEEKTAFDLSTDPTVKSILTEAAQTGDSLPC